MSLNFEGLGFNFGSQDSGLDDAQKKINRGFMSMDTGVNAIAKSATKATEKVGGFTSSVFKGMKRAATSTKKFTDKATHLTKMISGREGKKAQDSLETFQEGIEGATGRKAQRSVQAMAGEVDKASKKESKGLKKTEKSFDSASASIQGMGDAVKLLKKILGQAKLSNFASALGVGKLKEAVSGLSGDMRSGMELTNGLEGQMVSMGKSARQMGANFGYTGQDLKKFTSQASSLAYSLNMDVNTAANAIRGFTEAEDELRAMGFDSAASFAKFTDSFGVDADLLRNQSMRMTRELGLSNDQIKQITGSLAKYGQESGDVTGAMQQMQTVTDLLAKRKALGANPEQLVKYGSQISVLARGFFEKSQDSTKAMSDAVATFQQLTDAREQWGDMFAGTSEEFPNLVKELGIAGGDVKKAMKALESGPADFAIMMSESFDMENMGKEQLNHLRSRMKAAMGDSGEQVFHFMETVDTSTLKAMKSVRGATVDLGKLGDEAYSTGLTLQESFDRAEDRFKTKFRKISRVEARRFVSETGKEFDKFGKNVKAISDDGGPLGALVKKMSEATQLGMMVFIPKALRPMSVVMGTLTSQMGPVVQGMGALGLRFKHLTHPALLVTGAIAAVGLAFYKSEKNYASSIDKMAGSGKAMRKQSKEIRSLEKQLQKMTNRGEESTDAFGKLQKKLARSKEQKDLAKNLKIQNKEMKKQRGNVESLIKKRARLARRGKDTVKIDAKITKAMAARAKAEKGVEAVRASIQGKARDDSKRRVTETADQIKVQIKGFMAALPTLLNEGIKFISEEIGPLTSELWAALSPMFGSLWDKLKGVSLSGVAGKVGSFLYDGFIEGLEWVAEQDWEAAFNNVFGGISVAFTFLTEMVAEGVLKISEVDWGAKFSKAGKAIFSGTEDFLVGMFTGGEGEASASEKFGAGVQRVVITGLAGMGSIFRGLGSAWWESAVDAFNQDSLVDKLKGFGKLALATLIGGMLLIGPFRKVIMRSFGNVFGGVFKSIGGGFKKIFEPISKKVGGFFKKDVLSKKDSKTKAETLADETARAMKMELDKGTGPFSKSSNKKRAKALAREMKREMQRAMDGVSMGGMDGGMGGGGAEDMMGGGGGGDQPRKKKCPPGKRGRRCRKRQQRRGKSPRRSKPSRRDRGTSTPTTTTTKPKPKPGKGVGTPIADSPKAKDKPKRKGKGKGQDMSAPIADAPKTKDKSGKGKGKGQTMGAPIADAPDTRPSKGRDSKRKRSKGKPGGLPKVGGLSTAGGITKNVGGKAFLALGAAYEAYSIYEDSKVLLEEMEGKRTDEKVAAISERIGTGLIDTATFGLGGYGVKPLQEVTKAFLGMDDSREKFAAGLGLMSSKAQDDAMMHTAKERGFRASTGKGVAGKLSDPSFDPQRVIPALDAISRFRETVGAAGGENYDAIVAAAREEFAKSVPEFELSDKAYGAMENASIRFGEDASWEAKQFSNEMRSGFERNISSAAMGRLKGEGWLKEEEGEIEGRGPLGAFMLLNELSTEPGREIGPYGQREETLRDKIDRRRPQTEKDRQRRAKAIAQAEAYEKKSLEDRYQQREKWDAEENAEKKERRLEWNKQAGIEAPVEISQEDRSTKFQANLEKQKKDQIAKGNKFGMIQTEFGPVPRKKRQTRREIRREKIDKESRKIEIKNKNEYDRAMKDAQWMTQYYIGEAEYAIGRLAENPGFASIITAFQGIGTAVGGTSESIAGVTTESEGFFNTFSGENSEKFLGYFTNLWTGASGFFGSLENKVDDLFGHSISSEVEADFSKSTETITSFLTLLEAGIEESVGKAMVKGFASAYESIQTSSEGFISTQLGLYEGMADGVTKIFGKMWLNVLDISTIAGEAVSADIMSAEAMLSEVKAAQSKADQLIASGAVAAKAVTTPVVPLDIKPEDLDIALIEAVHYPMWYTKLHAPAMSRLTGKISDLGIELRRTKGRGNATPAKVIVNPRAKSNARSDILQRSGLGGYDNPI